MVWNVAEGQREDGAQWLELGRGECKDGTCQKKGTKKEEKKSKRKKEGNGKRKIFLKAWEKNMVPLALPQQREHICPMAPDAVAYRWLAPAGLGKGKDGV